MPIQWAGLGPELLLRVDRTLPAPLGAQLEAELREAIRSGRLASGERLPSSRELARVLGVSRGLVFECYSQLQAEGYLTSRAGSGTRVADAAREPTPAPARPAPPQKRFAIEFRPGTPDLTAFPRGDWAWAMRDAVRTAPAEAFGYGDPHGSRELREVLVAYLRRVRGVVADPERIVVCTGFAQGLNLLFRTLVQHGIGDVAVEDPGYFEQRESARREGLRGVAVPVDGAGVDVERLAATGARAVILTPAHQSPTGALLTADRRRALIEWAGERDAFVIEDDYDAEFRYDRAPVGAMQGLAPERIAVVGTVSKSLGPGLRLGWIVCPPELADTIAHEKERDDRGSPALEQLALARLIESGRYDRHLRRMRAVYGERRNVLVNALRRFAPDVELHGLAAGFHAVARLPDGVDEQEVVTAAGERSVKLWPMSMFRASGATEPPELVLGFGNLSDGEIERGIETVADLLAGG